ncbi:ABC transporter permease [Prosthecomicrobium pneumaticum]|uniref:Peptide/nickel transport system permease protein n=1 Tax=Prosthecomicrobium pneumaticum TaxID=81895 RepID=A0A7W9CTH7_9HYPH|nr:ABC transporter permease [Prosthecomicrobium pneumaticum]MBB5751620.1 peptide/nickel transport system permease protein [Prosthecomicrobium pneumaticum]
MSEAGSIAAGARPRSRSRAVLASLRRNAGFGLALVLTVVLLLLAIAGPSLWHLGPLDMDFGAPLAAPSFAHPMGTDSNGRDVFARFLAGARISLAVGAAVVVTGLIVGGGIGIAAGIGGRVLDTVLMRIVDALAAFPPLILAMAITVGLGVGLTTAAFGIMLSCVPFFARLMRADILRIRALPFIEASVAVGVGRWRIVGRHLLPHTAPTMLVQCASVFGYAILTLAGLGFIGLGAQIPEPEWGAMITDGLQYALTGQWWLALFPGFGVLAAVVAANLLADHAQAVLGVRGRER